MRRAHPDTAVLFMTHFHSPECWARYERLARECDGAYDPYLLFDDSHGEAWSLPSEPEPVTFRAEEAWRAVHGEDPPATGFRGARDRAIMYFALQWPRYRHYWCIEYDVAFTGSWRSLFDHFRTSDADLLGTTLYRESFLESWTHWDGLEAPEGEIGEGVRARGFFPILRISRRALHVLRAAYARGWKGHYEATMPSILLAADLEIEDLGGDGPFVRPGNLNRFYTNTPENDTPESRTELSPGTFVYRPARRAPGALEGKLWHPVKPPERPEAQDPWDAELQAAGSPAKPSDASVAWRAARRLERIAHLFLA